MASMPEMACELIFFGMSLLGNFPKHIVCFFNLIMFSMKL